LKTSRLSIKVSQEYCATIENRANRGDLSISAYIRYSLDNIGPKSDLSSTDTTLRRTPLEQLEIKDNQIERLPSALDGAWNGELEQHRALLRQWCVHQDDSFANLVA
jgi:hypothetical protein